MLCTAAGHPRGGQRQLGAGSRAGIPLPATAGPRPRGWMCHHLRSAVDPASASFNIVISILPFAPQVALLFRNHDDLLREFTYFLPDNTPPLAGGARGAARGPLPGKKAVGGYKAGRKAPPPLRKGGWGMTHGGRRRQGVQAGCRAGPPGRAAPGQCPHRFRSWHFEHSEPPPMHLCITLCVLLCTHPCRRPQGGARAAVL